MFCHFIQYVVYTNKIGNAPRSSKQIYIERGKKISIAHLPFAANVNPLKQYIFNFFSIFIDKRSVLPNLKEKEKILFWITSNNIWKNNLAFDGRTEMAKLARKLRILDNFKNIFWEESRSRFLVPKTRRDSRERFLRIWTSKLNIKKTYNLNFKNCQLLTLLLAEMPKRLIER